MFKYLLLFSISTIFALNITYAKNDKVVLAKNFGDYELRDMNADSKGNLYLATKFGGLYKSTDAGASWALDNRKTMGYDIHSILVSDFEGVYLGLADKFMLQSTDDGATWLTRPSYYFTGFNNISSMIATNQGYKLFISNKIVYVMYDNYAYSSCGLIPYNVLFKTNSGKILAFGNGIAQNEKFDLNNFNESIWKAWRDSLAPIYTCVNSDKKGRLYIGSQKGVFYSDDEAKHVTPFVSNLSDYSISAVFADDSKLIVGTDSAGLFISLDNANSWDNLINLNIKSKINKIFAFKNSTFVLTQKEGLFVSNDNAKSWKKIAGNISEAVSDSTEPTGWIPTANHYDLYPWIKPISNLKFVNDDSLVFVQDAELPLKFINANTGKLHFGFTIPDSANVDYFNVLNTDSVIVVYKKDTNYIFGVYLINDRKFNEYLRIKIIEYQKLADFYPCYWPSAKVIFKNIAFNKNDKSLYILYNFTYDCNNAVGSYNLRIGEVRKIETGEKKLFLIDIDMADNFNCYLRWRTIYDYYGNILYSLEDLPSSDVVCCEKLSPKNNYITIHNKKTSKLWIYPLLNSYHTKEILADLYYTDDPYFLSNEDYLIIYLYGKISLYNINETGAFLHPFDFILSDDLNQNWKIATSKNTNTIVFGGNDGKLHKWTPLSQLTSVGDEKEKIVGNVDYLYPNPASSFLNVPKCELCEKAQIYTLLGENSGEVNIINGKIDISSLNPGFYFLKINDKTYKFIKM